MKLIKNALISVYHKDNIEPLVKKLDEFGVKILSTGGTLAAIEQMGVKVQSVESLTNYPSILGGRVKTLHPSVFGGILKRRDLEQDNNDSEIYDMPEIDLVIVDLYPFEKTVAGNASEQEIIEKIDIGGIALIRAAAKNFKDVMVIPSAKYYRELIDILDEQNGKTTEEQRRKFALAAYAESSGYDTAIFNYFNRDAAFDGLRISANESKQLRYGENPHQKGAFFGRLEDVFDQLHGKAISYNNLVDIDSGIHLIAEFDQTAFAILKHTNACGLAQSNDVTDAWKKALAGDPVSAFGGVLITNAKVNKEVAEQINKIFFEVLVSPDFDSDAFELLKQKKNRILLKQNKNIKSNTVTRSMLNGYLIQDRDNVMVSAHELSVVTQKVPEEEQIKDLLFGMKAVKHTKSNGIVLAKDHQLIASGVGQTSRVDALKQAIEKAHRFGFDLKGAVMASDAFFPFADSVELAHKEGINAVIQPGGSRRDIDSINYCDENGMAMVFTGKRHFKH
ncbi:MAG: bifunctional phosphoribosylaminoimidazolecarboxamide formyltransferase/IMP cyclohydrolase [Bacteroidales bacterium]|nr:bifunctional phosphoribosylaminoimidazolecarboxamide formyltransferase/IMP cyclohydrolase [Bacteroidales bacterium]